MSACDEKLLEEDVGDEDYDLGEGEEEALLAGDFEFNEEEPEDVLDLEAGLDDLAAEIQDGGYDHPHSDVSVHVNQYQSPIREAHDADDAVDNEVVRSPSYQEGEPSSVQITGDEEEEELEEKEEEESRDRFRSERTTTVSLKSSRQSYGHIPDTLNQVPIEGPKSNASKTQRGYWGRGRGTRGHFRSGPSNQVRGGHGSNMGRLPWNSGQSPNFHHGPGHQNNRPGFGRSIPLVGPSPQTFRQPCNSPNIRPNPGPFRGSGSRLGSSVGRNFSRPNMRHNMGVPANMGPPENLGPPPNMGIGPLGMGDHQNMGPPPNIGPPPNMMPPPRNMPPPQPNMRPHPSNMGPPVSMGPSPVMGRNENMNSFMNRGLNLNSNMVHNMNPHMAPSLSGPMMRTMGPGGQNLGQQTGPGMCPQIGQNLGPHMGSNVGPNLGLTNIALNMGPGPSMGHNLGPGHNVGPNMGHHGRPNIGHPGGPNIGHPRGPNMGHPGGPNMGHPGGPNIGHPGGPNIGHPGGPNIGHPGAPNMGANVLQDIGPNVRANVGPSVGSISAQNIRPQTGHNMMFSSNLEHRLVPNIRPNFCQDIESNISPQFQNHGPNMAAKNSTFSFTPNLQVEKTLTQQPSSHIPSFFSNPSSIQRVVFNTSTSTSQQQQTVVRLSDDPLLRPSGQKIHINPHFRGNMQGEGRLHLEVNMDNTQFPQRTVSSDHHSQGRTFAVHQETRYQNTSSEWQSGRGMQPFSDGHHVNEISFDPTCLNSPSNLRTPMYPETAVYEDHSQQLPVQQPEDWTCVNQAYCPDVHQAAATAELSVAQQRFSSQSRTPTHPKFSPGRSVRGSHSGSSVRNQTQRNHSSGKRTLESSPGVVPVKQVRLETKRLKKVHNSNLHEVQTVDTLPDTTTTSETEEKIKETENESEDEETREYRKRIEDQKKKREQFLKLKEERRIQAALSKQKNNPLFGHKESVDMPSQSRCNVNKSQDSASQVPENQLLARQTPNSQQKQPKVLEDLPKRTQVARGRIVRGGRTTRPVALRAESVEVTAPLDTNDAGRSTTVTGRDVRERNGRITVTPVMHKGLAQTRQLKLVQNILTSHGSQASDEQSELADALAPGPSTSKSVAVENLSNSTNETQLRMMCNCIGRIENLMMDQINKRAVIRFAATDSALAFVKKYQRKIVDLSLIKVSLVND